MSRRTPPAAGKTSDTASDGANVTFDRQGAELNVGDRVSIAAVIESIDRVGVVTLRTEMPDETIGNAIQLKSRQVDKLPADRSHRDPGDETQPPAPAPVSAD